MQALTAKSAGTARLNSRRSLRVRAAAFDSSSSSISQPSLARRALGAAAASVVGLGLAFMPLQPAFAKVCVVLLQGWRLSGAHVGAPAVAHHHRAAAAAPLVMHAAAATPS